MPRLTKKERTISIKVCKNKKILFRNKESRFSTLFFCHVFKVRSVLEGF